MDSQFDYIIYKVVYDDKEEAKKILANFPREYRMYKNDPILGEVVGFEEAIKDCVDIMPKGITFVGTTAGVSKPEQYGNVYPWHRSMYLSLLGSTKRINNLFYMGYDAVGCFKHDTPMDKGGPYPCPWHFSGAQYWLRNSALKETGRHLEVANCRHGVEMYPGYILGTQKAYSIFNTDLDLYHNVLPSEDWVKTL